MSVASSVMSSISVVCDVKEQTLEEALDYVMIEIQRRLNNLHMEMRRLACLTEQEIDEIDDFKESVLFRDTSVDYVTGLVRLLEEIPPMANDLVGKSPPESKEWYTAERKTKLAAELAKYKAETAAAKAELKARGRCREGGIETVMRDPIFSGPL